MLLAGQKLLMVLDSCEHVASEVALLVDHLRARAPGLRLLATSQEPLKCHDEQVYRLRPLAVPEITQVEEAAQFGAVALFVNRAHSADPRFRLADDNLAPVIDICRRLDGIPLAIELAAARVPQLGVHGVREKLGERFRLLTGGKRTALRRHQTMRATVDWSYALLSASEQAVLRRLGVFVGGFSLELAQEVASGEDVDGWASLDALCSLVDKSLVMADAGESVRYRLLETTRGYALEKLADAGETKHWMERHAKVLRNLFVQADEARYGESATLSGAAYHELLAPELNNLRCALEWAMSDAEDWHSAIQLAGPGLKNFVRRDCREKHFSECWRYGRM
jgi:predicted ATPase